VSDNHRVDVRVVADLIYNDVVVVLYDCIAKPSAECIDLTDREVFYNGVDQVNVEFGLDALKVRFSQCPVHLEVDANASGECKLHSV